MDYSDTYLAKRIEHTLLKPDAGEAQIRKLCQEAAKFGFKGVCVQPCYVELCIQELIRTDIDVVAVVGFPLGANCSNIKALEARNAYISGACEADMVVNIGALKDRRLDKVREDIHEVVEVSKEFPGALVKVIIETALLTKEEKVLACELALQAGAQYVKTSTGFNGGGATVEDVLLMAEVVKGRGRVKASGGIKTREQAERLLRAGADRLGTSSGLAIITNT
ncbi:MAG: deoxyribose-phosphate aldolase [Firmicutes bacterium HGW-Firmicutes-12]|nr:MAG: deoxyribose-phosphate aldolase [Firmicutes bacterium HGW-Firmicutes-12]